MKKIDIHRRQQLVDQVARNNELCSVLLRCFSRQTSPSKDCAEAVIRTASSLLEDSIGLIDDLARIVPNESKSTFGVNSVLSVIDQACEPLHRALSKPPSGPDAAPGQ